MKRALLMAVGNLEIFTALLYFDIMVYGVHGDSSAGRSFSLSHDWAVLTVSLVIGGLGALLVAYNAGVSLKEGRRGIWQVIRGAVVLGFTALGLMVFSLIGFFILWPMLFAVAFTGIWALFLGLTRAALYLNTRKQKD